MKTLIVSAFALLTATFPAATEAAITVELQPSSLAFAADGKPLTVLVVVRNGTSDHISDVRLTSFPDPDIRVDAVPPIATLAPGSDDTWSVPVSTGGVAVDGRVVLRIDYVSQSGNAAPVKKIAVVTLPVKTQERTPVAQIADVEIKTTLESLDQQHPGQLYLVVTNKSGGPVDMLPIEAQGPSFIHIDTTPRVTLTPREVRAMPIGVQAKDIVQPGKQVIVIPVRLEWRIAGRPEPEHATIVATREVTVGVFGESEILKLLGVPTFVLLPGFLVLITVSWLWKNGVFREPDAKREFPLEALKPEFWIVAITASAIVAYAYRLYAHRDYLTAYGLEDVIKVWITSIFVFGVGSYLLIAAIAWAWRWWWKLRENEDPVSALRKLGRRGVAVTLVQVETNDSKRLLLVEPLRSDRPTVWATSQIVVEWQAQASEPLKQSIEKEREATGDASRLANLLAQGRAAGQLALKWKDGGPRPLKTTDVKRKLPALPIVDFA